MNKRTNILERIFLNKGKFSGNLFIDIKIKIEDYFSSSIKNYFKETSEIYEINNLERFPDLEDI